MNRIVFILLASLILISPALAESVAIPKNSTYPSQAWSEQQQKSIDDLRKTLTNGGYTAYKQGVLDTLANGEFEKLDTYFNTLQKAYELGSIDDALLLYGFSPFLESSVHDFKGSSYTAKVEEWRRKFPKSYPAVIASAGSHKQKAWEARGKDWANSVSKNGMRIFSEELKKAYEIAMQSNLTSKPIISLDIAVSSLAGAGFQNFKAFSSLVQKAAKIDPNNIVVRGTFLSYMRPRWFGSTEIMQAYAAAARKTGLSGPKADYLDSIIYLDIAESLYMSEQYELALPYAKKAAELRSAYLDYDFGQKPQRFYIDLLDVLERSKHDGLPSSTELMSALNLLLKDGRNVENGNKYYAMRSHIRLKVQGDTKGAAADLARAQGK